MNDRWIPPPQSSRAEAAGDATSAPAPPLPRADATLPPGTRLGAFELQRVLARGPASVVYLAFDHALAVPVAIQEYLPARLVQRDAGGALQALEPRHLETLARGRRAFIDEARMLAGCDHPALLRVLQLFEAGGSSYRVMPYYRGQRLLDLRRQMPGAPDEASLRVLLDGLLGALEALHRNGQAHGGVTPANILLLSDDRPLLLGPGAAGTVIGSDLVDSLMASIDAAAGGAGTGSAPPVSGAAADLLALADVMRFCITGEALAARAREPLAVTIAKRFEPAARPHYSAALLGTLDAAASSLAEDRPLGATQWRQWLDSGTLRQRHDIAEPAVAPREERAPSAPPLAALPPASFASDWIEPAPEPAPHRVAAALQPQRARRDATRRRWRLAALGGSLAIVAAGALAVALGVWDPLAPLRWGRPAELPAAIATPPPPPLLQEQPQPPAPAEPVAATAAPSSEPVAPATAAAEDDVAGAAADEAPGATPSTPLAAAAQTPPPPPPPPSSSPRSPARATRAGVASAAGPLAACAGKTEFARYRCAQAQCRSAQWAAHPQCERLRSRDEIG